jgi:hypothetical protein
MGQLSLRFKSVVTAALLVATAASCKGGTGQNVAVEGIDGPHVTFVDGKFMMTVVFKQVDFDGGIRVPLHPQKLPNSYIEIGPDFQSNGLLLVLAVDVNDIAILTGGAVIPLDPLTLPGGRPLPGVSTGWLPGLAVVVPRWRNTAFYVGKSLFGAFIPMPIPLQQIIGTFRFYDGQGNRVGNLSIVGQDEEKKNSGILVLIDLKGAVGNKVKDAQKSLGLLK